LKQATLWRPHRSKHTERHALQPYSRNGFGGGGTK
jgi:hypothetical protein